MDFIYNAPYYSGGWAVLKGIVSTENKLSTCHHRRFLLGLDSKICYIFAQAAEING